MSRKRLCCRNRPGLESSDKRPGIKNFIKASLKSLKTARREGVWVCDWYKLNEEATALKMYSNKLHNCGFTLRFNGSLPSFTFTREKASRTRAILVSQGNLWKHLSKNGHFSSLPYNPGRLALHFVEKFLSNRKKMIQFEQAKIYFVLSKVICMLIKIIQLD